MLSFVGANEAAETKHNETVMPNNFMVAAKIWEGGETNEQMKNLINKESSLSQSKENVSKSRDEVATVQYITGTTTSYIYL